MSFTLYPTDTLFLIVAAGGAAYFTYVRRHAQLRAQWRQVLVNPLGASAAVVLSLYLAIGLCDSVRVTRGNEILSLLDIIAAPLRTQVEMTYSAPFASTGFVMESSYAADGSLHRDFPRLRYGGRVLSDSAKQRVSDLLQRSFAGVALGALGSGAIYWLLGGWRRGAGGAHRRPLPRGRACWPWLVFASVGMSAGMLTTVAPYYHVFGTDKVGMDVLYQTLKSIRTGLVIGTVTTLISLPLAIGLGLAAGYFRGWVDDCVQYLYTTLSSVPGVLLIAAAALSLDAYMGRHTASLTSLEARADLKLLGLCVVLGVTGWTSLCRLLRAEVLKLSAVDFVTAARALGVSPLMILFRHLLPNTLHLVVITTVLDFSGLVLAEAVLTYIDIGVDPSMNSWGNMINSARLDLAREPAVWWSLFAAFSSMFVLVLAANLFADVVRDAFDPRLHK